MEIWYFKEPETQTCPVRVYVESLRPHPSNSLSMNAGAVKLLAKIHSILCHIGGQNEGSARLLIWLSGYPFHELRIKKDGKTLIRIAVARDPNRWVLLYAFEKPESYKQNSPQARAVERELELANGMYTKFKANPSSVERYTSPYE